MKPPSILCSVVLSALFALPCHAEFDSDPTYAMNENFFDGVPVIPQAEILMGSGRSQSLASWRSGCGIDSVSEAGFETGSRTPAVWIQAPTFLLRWTAASPCSVLMATRGNQEIFYFLLKARQGDWYQIMLRPQSGAATWIKDPHMNGLALTTHPLVDWVQSLGSYQTAHEIIDPIRAVPVQKAPGGRLRRFDGLRQLRGRGRPYSGARSKPKAETGSMLFMVKTVVTRLPIPYGPAFPI